MRHTSGPGHQPAASSLEAPSAFYESFLDPSLAFTCAYYSHEAADLAEAQTAKFDFIARKLRLRPYQTLLDVDCGWGSFVIHASKQFGVTAHGITRSAEQAEYAREWIRREGLEDQALVEHRDYRELVGELQFDRISAIGGLEHVDVTDDCGTSREDSDRSAMVHQFDHAPSRDLCRTPILITVRA